MKIEFKVGDIVSDVFKGVKESKKYKLIFKNNWYWGHSILINKKPLQNWNKDMTKIFDEKPIIDVANLGDSNHNIEIEFLRIE